MTRPASITISPRQRRILTQILSHLDAWPRMQLRAKIILLSAQGYTLKEIANQLAVTQSTVSIWRKEWRQQVAILRADEEAHDDAVLTLVIINVLYRGATKVKSSTISKEQLAQMMTIFEEDPTDSGYTIQSWTMHTVASEGIRRGIVPSTITGNMLASELRKIGFRNPAPSASRPNQRRILIKK